MFKKFLSTAIICLMILINSSNPFTQIHQASANNQTVPTNASQSSPIELNTNDTTKKSYQNLLDQLLPTQSSLFKNLDNQNQLATGDLEQDVIPRFLRLLVILSGMIITIIFTYVAFKLVLAKDDESQLTNLKTTLLQIIIGTVVILSSFAIILGIVQYFDSLR